MSAIIRAVLTASLIVVNWSANAADPMLPLEKVELFTSGVGSFQHAGEVTDDTSVEMTFKAEEVNDLLKSMVVEDAGGAASTVSYASRDPITKTLDTFAVKLTDNPSMGDLLGRIHSATARDTSLAERFATDDSFHALRIDAYLLATARAQNVGWIYVTDDVLANPWDALPSYWEAERAGVE